MTSKRMTTNTISIPAVDTSSLAEDDPRGPFARSVAHAGAVLGALSADNAGEQSACPEWNADQVAAHLVAVLDRIEVVGQGGDVNAMPILAAGDVGSRQADFFNAAERVHAAWSDPAVLGQMVTVPWGQIPGAVAIAVYTAEMMTHTWDLATAIGAEVDWDQDLAGAALATVQFGLPAEGRDDMPFGAVTPTADDATNITKLAAWSGRQIERF